MSGFGIFQKMNKKLEEGWKLTDADCPICKNTILANPTTKEMYCVSCEMPVKLNTEEEDTEVEVVGNNDKAAADYEDFENMIFQRQNDPSRKKADDMSKKTGELLLQGWAMLGDSCYDCLFPLMKSRQGETICVGCGPMNQKKEQVIEDAHKEDKSHSSTEIITKPEPPKEEKSSFEKVGKRPGFSVFQKINSKLEEGWKLTDTDCPICKTTILANLTTKEMYCVSCEMPVKLSREEEDTEVEVVENNEKAEAGYEAFENMVFKRQNDPRRKKENDLSKKTGELLLQGWTMLGDTCFDCLFPLMRSRQGETICVGCGPINQKKEHFVEEAPKDERNTKPEPLKEEKKPLKQVDDYIPKTKTVAEQYKPVEKSSKPERRVSEDYEHLRKEGKNIGQVYEAGRFDESISFYTRITELLKTDLERLSGDGLLSNLDKVKKAIEIQGLVDQAKCQIFKNME